MDISIIIVNFKSWKALGELLDSIACVKNNRFLSEVIVIDNRSDDGVLDTFKTKFPKIIFKENTGNNGFANGCNFGAKISTGNFLFFLNPDTIINEDAIFELWQTAISNPNYGIITCTQVDEYGNKYKENRFFPALNTLFGTFRFLNNFFNKKKLNSEFSLEKKIIFPNWATGAVILMDKAWYKKINGWNEKYWLYFEDVDICRRIITAGGKVALIKSTSILHKHGGASRINIKTKALTKTEVLISQHVYFNIHFDGINLYLIQFLLLFSHFLVKSILAFFGLIFFFIPKLYVNVIIFKNLFIYYFSAIINKTWISPRSTLYKK